MRQLYLRFVDWAFGSILRDELYGSEDRIKELLQQQVQVVLPAMFEELEDEVVRRVVSEIRTHSMRVIGNNRTRKILPSAEAEAEPIRE